jgi:predicted house-cleaning NTP pyrophosphatase (Maf/HAM1 superfamily)
MELDAANVSHNNEQTSLHQRKKYKTSKLASVESLLRDHQFIAAADAIQDARYEIFRKRRDAKREQQQLMKKRKPQQRANLTASYLHQGKKKYKTYVIDVSHYLYQKTFLVKCCSIVT